MSRLPPHCDAATNTHAIVQSEIWVLNEQYILNKKKYNFILSGYY